MLVCVTVFNFIFVMILTVHSFLCRDYISPHSLKMEMRLGLDLGNEDEMSCSVLPRNTMVA
jgi:hypothetical protein